MNYTWGNRITFSHLFIQGWDSAREVVSYPPAQGPLAIYDIHSFYSTIEYAILGVSMDFFFISSKNKYCRVSYLKLRLK